MKNKIKNILKYILTYTTLTILGAFIFMFGLSAQAETTTNSIYNNYEDSTWTLYHNDNLVAQETIGESEIRNINSIWLGISNDCLTYVNNLQTTTYLDLQINLEYPTNARGLMQFMGGTTLIQSIELYYNSILIQTFETNDKTNEMLNNEMKYYNKINITFWSDDYNWQLTYDTNFIAYKEGYNEALTIQQQKIDDLTNQLTTLQQNYNNLQQMYNGLAENEYTLENLFWSVGSVPMAFLLQSFNVNVLGLNLRAIITGLITALVVIWAIKKLLK